MLIEYLNEGLEGTTSRRRDHKKEAAPKLGDKGKRDSEGFRTPRWLGYVYMLIFIIMICM